MADHKLYRLRYLLEPGEFRRGDVNGNQGLTDAALVASILYPTEGGLDVAFFHGDGRTRGPLSLATQYQVWTLLAANLAGLEGLPAEEREIAQRAVDAVRLLVLKRSGEASNG